MSIYISTTQFWGIHIDSKLQWHEHINHVQNKISSGLYAVDTFKYVLQQIHMKTLYYSLIHPYLNSGCLLWGNTHTTFMHKLEVLQRKAIWTITKSNYNTTSSPLFKKTNILKLCDIYKTQISTFMYNYSKSVPSQVQIAIIPSRTYPALFCKYSLPTTPYTRTKPDIVLTYILLIEIPKPSREAS